jgi:hypothetical protein
MYLPDLGNGSGIKRTKPFPLLACWIVLSRKFLKMPIAKLDRVVHIYSKLASIERQRGAGFHWPRYTSGPTPQLSIACGVGGQVRDMASRTQAWRMWQ